MKTIQKIGHLKYGATKEEKEIIDFIVHSRRLFPGRKRTTFQEIADNLNAQGLFPRRAKKWTPVLIFNIHKRGYE